MKCTHNMIIDEWSVERWIEMRFLKRSPTRNNCGVLNWGAVLGALPPRKFMHLRRVTQQLPHVEYDMPTIPEHLLHPQFLVGFMLLDHCFVDRCLYMCIFSFWTLYCLSVSNYAFWLLCWYLQALLDPFYVKNSNSHTITWCMYLKGIFLKERIKKKSHKKQMNNK